MAVAALVLPAVGEAAFPGSNGKIAYEFDGDIWAVDPDGTNDVQLTTDPARDRFPDWSPDGKQIAFISTRSDPNPATCTTCVWEIYLMDADGTDVRKVSNFGGTLLISGALWSPDGTRLTYYRGGEVWTIRADGSDIRQITPPDPPDCSYYYGSPIAWSPDGTQIWADGGGGCFDHDYSFDVFIRPDDGGIVHYPRSDFDYGQDWSPDAQKLLIGSDGYSVALFWVRVGGGYQELTPGTGEYEDGGAAWSPDGTTVVFGRYYFDGSPAEAYLVDAADGGNLRPLGGPHPAACCYSWQPIPINHYARPKGASPTRVSLVPAYQPCTSPNRTHGPPLAFGSCNPPTRVPGQLTIGTFDANGQPANSVSYIRINPIRGNPFTPADEADVRMRGTINDIRLASDLSDYTGNVSARLTIQITDRDNTPSPGGPGAATVQEFTHSQPLGCAATADTTVGGTCDFDTTVEALVPGAVKEQQRAIWQLRQIQVYDGAGNAFLRQGIFVP
jgi:hypothetical protein